jgi:hypothetical protein
MSPGVQASAETGQRMDTWSCLSSIQRSNAPLLAILPRGRQAVGSLRDLAKMFNSLQISNH